jgi:hypothetical protein
METTVDVKEEVAKLHVESRELLKFLLDRYVRNGEYEFDKSMEVPGMNKGDVPMSFDKLIASSFGTGSSARPTVFRLNRTRADSLRTLGGIK